MTTIEHWQATALNTAPDSANEIHGDTVAQEFGFKGGLVPGVTVAAYLTHPAVEAWGMAFLERGFAHVRVGSPLYHEEPFSVQIGQQDDEHYEAELVKADGTLSATGEVALRQPSTPPVRRMDEIAARDYIGPAASVDRWQYLRDHGCKAFRYRWGSVHNMKAYLADQTLMPALLAGTAPFANMSFLLGISNWILAGNAHMNPWVHLETWSQNHAPVPWNTVIVAEMTVKDYYKKKGHEFVDVDVFLFDEADNRCLATITLRAIYKLRGL